MQDAHSVAVAFLFVAASLQPPSTVNHSLPYQRCLRGLSVCRSPWLWLLNECALRPFAASLAAHIVSVELPLAVPVVICSRTNTEQLSTHTDIHTHT